MAAKNITYLLGAGASYNALPLNEELAHDMANFNQYFNSSVIFDSSNSDCENPFSETQTEHIIFEIMRIGIKAKFYSSVDNYAYAVSSDPNRLSKIKAYLSIYFAIIHKLRRSKLEFGVKERAISEIDSRVYNLIVKSMEKHSQSGLIENVNFITWNYDIQIEKSCQRFLNERLNQKLTLEQINGSFVNFIPTKVPTRLKQQVFHLNGVSGFYHNSLGELSPIIQSELTDSDEIIKSLIHLPSRIYRREITFEKLMTFAWEKNPESNFILGNALAIAANTDILVVIGYSFPDFNFQIDKKLFDSFKKKTTKYFYQDLNADKNLLIRNFEIAEEIPLNGDIKKVNMEIDVKAHQFVIPNW